MHFNDSSYWHLYQKVTTFYVHQSLKFGKEILYMTKKQQYQKARKLALVRTMYRIALSILIGVALVDEEAVIPYGMQIGPSITNYSRLPC